VDSFTYKAHDGLEEGNVATVTITVNPFNDDPVANDDVAATPEGFLVVVSVLSNDTDADGDALTVDSVTQGSDGSVTTNGTTATYTPDGGFSGVDTFTYTVIDGNGGSDEGTVTVTVVYVPPAAVLDILMWKQVWRGKYWRAMAQVRVKDTFGDPIVGAKVRGHWSGAYARNVSATTGSLGRITTRTSWLRRPGTALFTVDKITKDGTDYSLAGETSDSESFP
jgi:hypothetical protein